MVAKKSMENTESKSTEQDIIKSHYDVIVVGGGPSGSSAATFLGMAGKDVLLLDRAKFPREKTCGDGISGKSVHVLQELGITEGIKNVEHLDMYGVTFSSPKGVVVQIPAAKEKEKTPPGYVCRREVFDDLLFQNAKNQATVIEQFNVDELIMENGAMTGVNGTNMATKEKMTFKAKIVVIANGAGSVFTEKLGLKNNKPEHQVSALRAYYEGVEGVTDQIELHFVKEALPGYFWIFPLPDKKANVWIGMLVPDIQKNKINMEKVMYDIIEKHPMFAARFKNAKKITEVKRWHLPLGSWRPSKAYGNGFVLVGDCASLIDPFTGEGIGNALISGKIASKIIVEAFEKNDFSETVLSKYHTELYDEVGDELKTSYNLQRLGTNTWVLNMIIDKASRSSYVRDAISSTLLNPEAQKKFTDPVFILRCLFA